MQFKDIWLLFRKNLLVTQLILVVLIISLGAFTFHFIEWRRILDSFYFIISVMTTIWFGDFTPKTDIGKIFVMFFAIIGVPFFVSIGGLILENRFRKYIEYYLRKVHKELKSAEVEIKEVEEKVIKKLKRNLENTQETVENIQEEIEVSQKNTWWKIWKKNKKNTG